MTSVKDIPLPRRNKKRYEFTNNGYKQIKHFEYGNKELP